MSVSVAYFGVQGFAFPLLFSPSPPDGGDSQVIQLADAVAAAILSAWNASSSPPGVSDAVARVYEVPIADAEYLDSLTGRKVWVFPAEYGRAGLTRHQDNFHPKIAVVIAERYTDEAPVPTAWLDVRTEFVEQVVFLPIADPRRAQILTGVTPEDDGANVVVYDAELLVMQKLFLSMVTVQYRLQYP